MSFKHNYKKWKEVLKHRDKITFASDHKIIKHTEELSFLDWGRSIWVFPNLEQFRIDDLQEEGYATSNLGIDCTSNTIKYWDWRKAGLENCNLSYGVRLGMSVNIDDKELVKNKISKELI